MAQLKQAGAPPEVIAAAENQIKPVETDFEVWEENWLSWQCFLTVQTQWLVASGIGGGARVGLLFPGVESGLRMSGVPRRQWQDVFADLRTIQYAVLEYDREIAK